MTRAAKPATPKVGKPHATSATAFEIPPESFTRAMLRIYGEGAGRNWYESKEFKMFIAGARFMSEYSAARSGRVCDSLQHMVGFEGRPR